MTSHTHTDMHTYTCTCARTRIDTRTHKRVRARTHTHTRAHTSGECYRSIAIVTSAKRANRLYFSRCLLTLCFPWASSGYFRNSHTAMRTLPRISALPYFGSVSCMDQPADTSNNNNKLVVEIIPKLLLRHLIGFCTNDHSQGMANFCTNSSSCLVLSLLCEMLAM